MTKREKIEDRLQATKPIIPAFQLDPVIELEIARRRARQGIHDSSRILAEASHFMTAEDRPVYTSVISALMSLRNRLDELSPLARGSEFAARESEAGGTQ
jgi:hypothetical protein